MNGGSVMMMFEANGQLAVNDRPIKLIQQSDAVKQEPAALLSVILAVWAVGIFACWTLLHAIATFGHIPWATTKVIAIPVLIVATLLTVPVAKGFWMVYYNNLDRDGSPAFFPPIAAAGIFTLAACLYVVPSYTLRFCLVAAVFLLCLAQAVKKTPVESLSPPLKENSSIELLLFAMLLMASLLFTLCAYRSDYDDSVYLQMALQTVSHPDRAPLTYDSSLGYVVDFFRFQPYRFASYENFTALVADVCSINLITVYYILLPAVGSILCMCSAYLLTRWFLGRRAALAALGICLLLLIAWGEAHLAYGNRVLVRLYQGKGWLIAFTTPFVALCGLMLMRGRKVVAWLCYVAGDIAAVGFSSSGMVVACGTALMLAPLAFTPSLKKTIVNLFTLGSGVIYPILCGVILAVKFHGAGSIEGMHMPINSSLGGDGRECLSLALLAFSACLWGLGRRRRELVLLVGGILFCIMNPWGSEIIAKLSVLDMSWRLAWAVPIPIILAISLASFWSDERHGVFFQRQAKTALLAGVCVLAAFLCIAPWTCRPGNNDFHFSFPAWKLPSEYAEVEQLAALLPKEASNFSVLAPFNQGAWLPVIRPELRVIMPGHTYPLVLPSILSRQEFQDRMELQGVVENLHLTMLAAGRMIDLLSKLKVKYIIVSKGNRSKEIVSVLNDSGPFRAELAASTTHFDIIDLLAR
ncbi:MAG: DUF6077 domain-containing protein [Desulfobulbaceae bacterium]|jgi:hypothetical protein|nr:DUF6077 domain-containing protein [Desulfobulbaceae bacterium]